MKFVTEIPVQSTKSKFVVAGNGSDIDVGVLIDVLDARRRRIEPNWCRLAGHPYLGPEALWDVGVVAGLASHQPHARTDQCHRQRPPFHNLPTDHRILRYPDEAARAYTQARAEVKNDEQAPLALQMTSLLRSLVRSATFHLDSPPPENEQEKERAES